MSLLSPHLLPSDVRQVIDRTDDKLNELVERLSIIAEQHSEQNDLLRQQCKLLAAQNKLLHERLR